ncbi:MAG: hypothetical protein OEO79_12555 [Gemmatimonadota bacterium]|nr:hypothetical protein [Gemmatimonadota bacterium]MDH3423293.1 hypothetical protein [Gemmatimonadota bacterium]
MRTYRLLAAALLAAAAMVSPGGLQAQDPPPAPQQEPELVFEREVFEYPSFSRSNPFTPLSGSQQGGPRYEQLTLTGIIWDSDPTFSVAVVSTGALTIAADGTATVAPGAAYNAKVGQRIGNTTIREIQRDRVVVDVEEFGLTDRRTMFIASRRQGGTQ